MPVQCEVGQVARALAPPVAVSGLGAHHPAESFATAVPVARGSQEHSARRVTPSTN